MQLKGSAATESIATRTVVTTVPAATHPLLKSLAVPMEKDRIKVDEFMAVAGVPGLWRWRLRRRPAERRHALADDRSARDPPGQDLRKKYCRANPWRRDENAVHLHRPRQARITGPRIRRRGNPRHQTLRLFAWFLWRTIYLGKFPGLDRQIRIATDWTLDLFLPRNITEVRIFKPDEVLAEHFEAGETVFEQGDFGDKIYFIHSGEAEAIQDGQIVAQLATGDVFGEIALISNQARAAAIRARTALDIVSVNREAFHQLLANVPGVKMTMQEVMNKHLAGVRSGVIGSNSLRGGSIPGIVNPLIMLSLLLTCALQRIHQLFVNFPLAFWIRSCRLPITLGHSGGGGRSFVLRRCVMRQIFSLAIATSIGIASSAMAATIYPEITALR